jgi:hypothetical protein
MEGPFCETSDDGVGDASDPGLQGEQLFGETSDLHFVLEEFDDVAGNRLGGFVDVTESPAIVEAF